MLFKTDVEDLIGKELKTIKFGDLKESWGEHKYFDEFSLEFADGSIAKFVVTGDCCSTSWIEHVSAPNVEGATLLDVTELGEYEKEKELVSNHPEHDEAMGGDIQVYNTRFRTSKGDIIIEYRNSSNGYYGGSISRVIG